MGEYAPTEFLGVKIHPVEECNLLFLNSGGCC